MNADRCHCGRPLHYKDPKIKEYMMKMVERGGRMIVIKLMDGKSYRVDRHYIALHGVSGMELDSLGFEEIKNESSG